MKPELSEICIRKEDSVRTIFDRLQRSSLKICLVLEPSGRIIGTVTDGDCRRALLKGATLETPALEVMNKNFVMVEASFSIEQVHSLMRLNEVDKIPIVDSDRRLVDLVTASILQPAVQLRPNPVLILAGGKGERLRPLTNSIPKPMLPVRGRPMLEQLILDLVSQNFYDIHLSINYLGKQIEDHFGNGEHLGCKISYVREDAPMGTAGPLRLLDVASSRPILVLNGDLVTKVDFGALIDFHHGRQDDITVGVSGHKVEVPFGVLTLTEDAAVTSVEEKPVFELPINAGVYAVNPKMIAYVPELGPFGMTDLLNAALKDKRRVGAFLMHEQWLDVGIPEQYQKANRG